jgi:peptide/nickel transport system substrate-binding protein
MTYTMPVDLDRLWGRGIHHMKARRMFAAAAALALIAGACGGDDDTAEPPADATDDGGGDSGGDDGGDTGGDDGGETGGDDGGDTGGDEGGDTGGDSTAGQGGNLVMLQWQAPSQANSLLSNGTKDLLAGSLVLEPFAEFTPDGEVVPALATEIPTQSNGGISEDLTTITWHLRDDVLWSDGTPFTAADAVFTYEYCTNEETGCSVEVFSDVVSVVADDDYTVTITFDAPKPYPFAPFVGYTSPVIQAAQFADCVGAAAKSCSEQNFKPNGTGPYVVTDLRPEDTVSYAMNEYYRGIPDGKPFFGTIEIKGGGDAEASARSVLEVGEADYAWNLQVAPEIIAPMVDAGNGTVKSAFASSVEHINLNQTDPYADPPSEGTPHPLFVDNPDLHRALSIAINRDELVTVGYGPTGAPTCNMWPVGAEASTHNDWCLTQDVDGANALLDGLGYLDTDGDGVREAPDFGPLEFDFVTSTNAVRQSNQELIKSHWEAIGVKANMKNEDASLFFDGTCAADACIWKFFSPIEMFTNSSSGPDAGTYLNGWTSAKIPTSATSWGGDNIPRLNSPEYDALDAQLSATPLDDPARKDLVIQMNDILSTTAIIPLIHRANPSAFANDIENVGDLNGWDSEYWNIEEWTRAG